MPAFRLPRPLRIALATAVLVVVAVGVRVGVPIYRQHVAVREIERLGGTASTQNGGPQWVRDRVGDDWMSAFDDVVGVDLSRARVTDADLAHVRGLTKLRVLWLINTQVTDAGLVHLRGLTKLQWLWLQGTDVSDEGIFALRAALPDCYMHWGPVD